MDALPGVMSTVLTAYGAGLISTRQKNNLAAVPAPQRRIAAAVSRFALRGSRPGKWLHVYLEAAR